MSDERISEEWLDEMEVVAADIGRIVAERGNGVLWHGGNIPVQHDKLLMLLAAYRARDEGKAEGGA